MSLIHRSSLISAFVALSFSSALQAELPAPTIAKLLVVVSKGIGQGGKVASKDAAVAGELKNMGSLDNGSRVAYASSDGDVKAEVGRNACVIANNPRYLSAGAVMALVDDGGKPKFVISRQNMEIFGITFPDAVLRIATYQ